MPEISNRVQETSTTTGTGTLTLAGAVTGYVTFNSAFSNGDVVFYTIDDGLGNWEIGAGTIGTGTLARTTVIESSNSNNLVPFGSGAKRVFCTAPTRALLPDQTSNNGKVLTTDGTSPSWTTPASGTVTSVSVTSANGLAGTSSGGATPSLTLSTSVTGVLKGNGTAISAAASGTDYAPATSGTSILKGNGSGGFSSASAGTDYQAAITATGMLKGAGSGSVGAGTAGTDYVAPGTTTNFTAQQYFGNATLTDAATIAWNAAAAQVATFTFVSSNRTMGAPSNLVNGAFYGLAVIQNAGSNTLTWNSVFKFPSGTAPTLSTAAGAKDYFVFRSDGSNMMLQGVSLGVA